MALVVALVVASVVASVVGLAVGLAVVGGDAGLMDTPRGDSGTS